MRYKIGDSVIVTWSNGNSMQGQVIDIDRMALVRPYRVLFPNKTHDWFHYNDMRGV